MHSNLGSYLFMVKLASFVGGPVILAMMLLKIGYTARGIVDDIRYKKELKELEDKLAIIAAKRNNVVPA